LTLNIYTVEAGGTRLRALTTDGHSHDPSWSPNGRRILFLHDSSWPANLSKPQVRISDFSVDLYVMDSDDANPRLLRRLDGSIFSATWSPDGKSIAVTYIPRLKV
jgi:Tol biopolymer transport system component